jgi:hypothetical protein
MHRETLKAARDARGKETYGDDQDSAEHKRFKMVKPSQKFRHDVERYRTDYRAPHRGGPANHDENQDLQHGLKPEIAWMNDRTYMREKGARRSGHHSGNRKDEQLVPHDTNAHGSRKSLRLLNRRA